jgi:predicted nuclease with TOPRIM domain
MNPALIAIIAAFFGAIPGGLIAYFQYRRFSKKDQFDFVFQQISAIQAANEQLRESEAELRAEMRAVQDKNIELVTKQQALQRDLGRERDARGILNQRLSELVFENTRLHEYIQELREQIGTPKIDTGTLLEMKTMVGRLAGLATMAAKYPDLPTDIMTAIVEAATAASAIRSNTTILRERNEDDA